MTDLSDRWSPRAMQTAANDQPSSDTCPDRDIEHCADTTAGADRCFGERRAVTIVSQHRGYAELLLAPIGERESFPSFDLMAFRYHAVIHWSAEADANAVNAVS
jgi:hypothetical protein